MHRRYCILALVGMLAFSAGMSGGTCNVQTGTTGIGGGSGGGSGSGTSSVEAELLEQLSLERINRARLKPTAEAASGGISLNEGVPVDERISSSPKQALAMNALLRAAARDHSQDMLNRNYFAHDTPEGDSPFDRIRAAGYAYTAAGENLAFVGTTGDQDPVSDTEKEHRDLFVDEEVPDRGHRVVMLTDGFSEIGIGIVQGSYTDPRDGRVYANTLMQTQNFGTPPSATVFVLGVVYDDSNANGQYDHGEGTANASVTLDSTARTTNAAGGYAFEVSQAGTYTLRFSTGQTQAITIGAGTSNVKVDLIDGQTVEVNLGLGPLN